MNDKPSALNPASAAILVRRYLWHVAGGVQIIDGDNVYKLSVAARK